MFESMLLLLLFPSFSASSSVPQTQTTAPLCPNGNCNTQGPNITTYVILAVVAVARLIQIQELATELKGGKPQWEVTDKDNRMNSILMMLFAISFFAFYNFLILQENDIWHSGSFL